MRGPRSLQGRLALTLAVAVAALWATAALLTAHHLRGEMDAVFDSALEETAQRILPLAAMEILARDPGAAGQRIETLRAHREYLTYLVRDAAGAVLMRSHAADPAMFPPVHRLGFETTATHRLYHDAALRGALTISVAEPVARRRHAKDEALAALAAPMAVLAPLSVVLVWGLTHLGLAPLRAFGDAIARRGAADLAPLGAADLPTEIAPVAEAVDGLMARLGRALDAERRFAANAAHELRTPVAAALAQLDRLVAETPDPTARDRAAAARDALWRLARRAEKLLQLSRAEGAALRRGAPADLRPVLRLVAGELDPAGTRLVLTLPERPVLSTLDPDAFAILARNLVENALRHGDPAVPVDVSLDGAAVLRVTNAGPILQGDALLADDPAVRTGLGLSIVRAVALGAGLDLRLQSPAPGRPDGVEAEVALIPAARSPLPG
jgi:two-component system OmpR family sensor kinase